MSIRVQTPQGIVEFPDGMSEQDMAAALSQLPKPATSHETPHQPDIIEQAASGARGFDNGRSPVISTGGGRGTGFTFDRQRQVGQQLKEDAPTIAALAATAAVPELGPLTIPARLAVAGGSGYLGARVRGDDRGNATVEGIKQAGLQAGGEGGVRVIQSLAKIPYNGSIPKHVLDKFPDVDLARQGLDERVWIGTKRGTATAKRVGAEAARDIEAAAPSVPVMSADDVEAAFANRRARATTARKPQRVSEIDDYVKAARAEIGQTPMDGAAQLARKGELEQEGKTAMHAANANMAPVNPQLANIERRATVSNLRRSPQMKQGLDRSQGAIGLTKAAKAQENSSMLNRFGTGYLNTVKSPLVLSGTGIVMNDAARAVDPQVMRLLDLIMAGGSHK